MGKCWMIEDDEERIMPISLLYLVRNFPGVKLTEYPSNPLEPIREVAGDMKDFPEDFFEDEKLAIWKMRSAIEKYMAILEGK